jgi:eukaryotic-like serine/threonine-protein kinase
MLTAGAAESRTHDEPSSRMVSATSSSEPRPSSSVRDSFDALLQELARGAEAHEGPGAIQPGTVLAGKFRVERCLGMGSMGAVYEVLHVLTRHRRALKVLNPHRGLSDELVRRFFVEASAAARVDSTHLVETFDAGRLPSGEPYVVMELLNGISFRALLDRAGKLDAVLACELIAQAAQGIERAHRAGIIHRDIKPENLFIVRRDDTPFVKVLDFGISKFSSASIPPPEVAHVDALFGTPAYMAPEQYQNASDADARTDVFALGAVLFECLGGQPPYMAASVYAIGARLMTGTNTALSALRRDLDPGLVEVIHRAIAADPSQRIQSARALRDALAPFREKRAPLRSGFVPKRGPSTWSLLLDALHHTPLSRIPLPYLVLMLSLACVSGFGLAVGLAWLFARVL